MTNMGVTKRVYEEHVGYGVSEHTMQNLTKEDVEPIYKKNYWDRVKGDDLPEGLDLCIFDFNSNKIKLLRDHFVTTFYRDRVENSQDTFPIKVYIVNIYLFFLNKPMQN